MALRSRTLAGLALSLAAAAPLAAANEDRLPGYEEEQPIYVRDLRLAVGMAPSDYDAKYQDGSKVSDSYDSSIRAEVDYLWSFSDIRWDNHGACIFGIGAQYSEWNIDSTTTAAGAKTYAGGLVAQFGYAVGFGRHLHVEAAVVGGLGVAHLDEDDVTDSFGALIAKGLSDTSLYTEGGVRVGAYWTFHSGWQAGLDVRYLMASTIFERRGATAGTDTRIELDISGAAVLLSGGYRF